MKTLLCLTNTDAGVRLAQPTTGRGRFIRQTGCPGLYADITLSLEPQPGNDTELSWEVAENKLPFRYFDAVASAIKAFFLEPEEFGGQHLKGVCIRVVDGSWHPVDSGTVAFAVATKFALREALTKVGLLAHQ